MDQLPVELLSELLSYLDHDSIQELKKVCSKFDSVAEDFEVCWKNKCEQQIGNNCITSEIIHRLYSHTEKQVDWRRVYRSWKYLKEFHKYSYEVKAYQLFEKPSPYMTLHRGICSVRVRHEQAVVLAFQSGCFSSRRELYIMAPKSEDFNMLNLNDIDVRGSPCITLVCPKCGPWQFYTDYNFIEVTPGLYLQVTEEGYCSFYQQLKYNPHSNMLTGEDPVERDISGFNVIKRCSPYNATNVIEQSKGGGWVAYLVDQPVSCVITYANLVIVGSVRGLVTVFYNEDVNELDFTHYVWAHQFNYEPIFAMQVMEREDDFVVYCCTQNTVYSCIFSRTKRA